MDTNEISNMSRRRMLAASGALIAAGAMGNRAIAQDAPATETPKKPLAEKRFKIAGDDLFLDNKRQNVEALRRAAKANLDGVVVDMGSRPNKGEFKSKFTEPGVYEAFLKVSEETGVAIAGLGFFAMYAHVMPDISNIADTMKLWVDSMVRLNTKLGYMPLMTGDGTLAEPEHKDVYDRTVKVFKEIAPEAEKAGVVLGIESNLDGDGYNRFLDAVGSPAVQAYYNVGVGLANGYNAYEDLRKLGKERIAALHLEQGSVAMMPGDPPETHERRLGDGLINFPLLRYVLLKLDWSGWMSIARSRLKGTTSGVPNMTANAAYLRTIFPE
jgi:L-ribulose-5-phosphate 3-epimerase